jgi:hypothetical protein
LNAFDAGAPLIDLLTLSPDGSEVLIGRANPSAQLMEEFLKAQATGRCAAPSVAEVVASSPRTLLVLVVASRIDVYARWFEESLVTFACDDVEAIGFRTSVDTWWPGGGAYSASDGCDEPVELRVNSHPVGSGDHLRILGFIDPATD